MYMPRLSLYKPQKGNDYNFIDKQVYEMFTVGGTDLHVHKYLGTESPSDADATADEPQYDNVKPTNIQDLLFLENRDRKYDPDVYTMRGIYNVQDLDFNLSQFGLFLSNDTLMLTIHINSSVKTIGRKIISGDVIELPHLKDEYALNDHTVGLKRFYVVEDVNRAAEGYSQTWYPHLYRLKLKQIVDSQEFKEILDLPAEEDVPGGNTLRDLLSTYDKEMQINNAIVNQAEVDSPKSGYETNHFFSLQLDENGNTALVDSNNDDIPDTMQSVARPGYTGYLLGDGIPTNGSAFGHGIAFTSSPENGDFFLRTDFAPNRLFRYDGDRWVKQEDNVRMGLSNTNGRHTQKGSFVNNNATDTIGGETTVERQSLSQALKPKADE
jgi:hypothetical protein|tara:strand:- start:3474 stop:4616 length:1143 start_codon:yes stop_codon:yes gene_type:complete